MAHAREDECPLCCEEFSVQDKNFRPCQCGYEVSTFISLPDLALRLRITSTSVDGFSSTVTFSLFSPDLHVVLASYQERYERPLPQLPRCIPRRPSQI